MSEMRCKEIGTPQCLWEFESDEAKDWFNTVFYPAINPCWDAFLPGTKFNIDVPQVFGEAHYFDTLQFEFVGWFLVDNPGKLIESLDEVHAAMK